jgi:hypothetical protein
MLIVSLNQFFLTLQKFQISFNHLTPAKEIKFSGRFLLGKQELYEVKSQLKIPQREKYLKY